MVLYTISYEADCQDDNFDILVSFLGLTDDEILNFIKSIVHMMWMIQD